jgi:hypothetical protein
MCRQKIKGQLEEDIHVPGAVELLPEPRAATQHELIFNMRSAENARLLSMMQQRQDRSHLDLFGLRHQQSSPLALSTPFLDFNKRAVMSLPNVMVPTSMPANDDSSDDSSNNLVSRRPDSLFSSSAPPKESHALEPHQRSQSVPVPWTVPFPWKLHDMLNDMDRNGCDHVVSWLPSGCAFKVHDPELFVASISKCLLDIPNPFCSFLRPRSHTSFLCYSLIILSA